MTVSPDNRKARGAFLSTLPVLVAAVVLIATVGAIVWWFNGGAVALAREHGPLELVQDLMILAILFVFVDAYRCSDGAVGVAAGALSLMTAAAFVRELEIKNFAGPEWYRWLGTHGLQEVLFVAMLLPIPIYLIRQRRYFWGVVRLAVRWPAWPIYVAAILLATSIYLDERVVKDYQARFWEELIETYGYGFLLMAALRHRKLVGDPDFDQPVS